MDNYQIKVIISCFCKQRVVVGVSPLAIIKATVSVCCKQAKNRLTGASKTESRFRKSPKNGAKSSSPSRTDRAKS